MIARCRVCQQPIDVHGVARGGLCADYRCRSEDARQWYDERMRAEEAARRRAAEALCVRIRPDLGRVPVAFLPLNARPLERLPAERRSAFEDHVRSVVTAAFAALAPENPLDLKPVRSTPLSRAGCALCRGNCCFPGGPHDAFFDTSLVQRIRDERPGITAEEILGLYFSSLPAESYRDSCVYHGERGCTLPTKLRPALCRTYLCQGLSQFVAEARAGGVAVGFAVCEEDGERPRYGFLTPQGAECVEPVGPKGECAAR